MAELTGKTPTGKKRNLIIILVVIAIIAGVIYFYFAGGETDQQRAGAKVPRITTTAQYRPGTQKLSKEYLQTLLESDRQAAEAALKEGRSAVPTIIRTGVQYDRPGEDIEVGAMDPCLRQCVECCRGRVTPSRLLNKWVQDGKVSAVAAAELSKLQDQGASVSDYAALLNRLVKEGKITPEQAKALLDAYRGHKKPADAAGALVDQMLGEGNLSAETGQALRKLQDKNVSVNDYAKNLDKLVQNGKLTKEQAGQLLKAYRQDKEKDIPANNAVDDMLVSGAISAETANDLRNLNASGKSVEDYTKEIQEKMRKGELTSEQAQKLIGAYRQQVAEKITPPGVIPGMPLTDYDKLVAGLLASGDISPEVAQLLRQLKAQGLTAAAFGVRLNQLVQQGKLTAEIAQKLLAAYSAERAAEITPAGTPLEQLQRAQQQQALQQQEAALQQAAMASAKQKRQEKRLETVKIQQEQQAVQNAMGGQAKALFASWNAVPQVFVSAPVTDKDKDKAEGALDDRMAKDKTSQSKDAKDRASGKKGIPLIKAGSILFGVLDTSVNSDQPGPVMATIVAGKLKGAKLMGNLTRTPDGERVVLQFTLLTMPHWPDSIKVNSIAMNPNTARTAIASDVDHHYLLRYSSVFASSFIEGYAKAVQTSGATTTDLASGGQEISGPQLSAKDKIMVGLGEIGSKLSEAAKKTFNRQPTVTVKAGVGIGLLFTDDVFREQK